MHCCCCSLSFFFSSNKPNDSSFAGVYQPPLPVAEIDFIITSNFYDVVAFLGITGTKVNLYEVRERAKKICSMSFMELQFYNKQLPSHWQNDDLLQACFRAIFVSVYLTEGVGFPLDHSITAVDVINGQKVGWALGSTLYEINTLPWEFGGKIREKVGVKRSAEKQKLLSASIFGDGDDSSAADYAARLPLVALLAAIVAVTAVARRRAFRSRSQSEVVFSRCTGGVRSDLTSPRGVYGSIE